MRPEVIGDELHCRAARQWKAGIVDGVKNERGQVGGRRLRRRRLDSDRPPIARAQMDRMRDKSQAFDPLPHAIVEHCELARLQPADDHAAVVDDDKIGQHFIGLAADRGRSARWRWAGRRLARRSRLRRSRLRKK
jgi:hypothetical protein